MTVVAVDANGADLGPAEVAAGARIAAQQPGRAGTGDPVRPRRASWAASSAAGVEIVDAPISIAKDPRPGAGGVRGVAGLRRSCRAAARRRRRGDAAGARLQRVDRRRAGRRAAPDPPRARRAPPRAGSDAADPRAPGDPARRRRQCRRATRDPRAVRVHGGRLCERGARYRAPAGRAALERDVEAQRGQPARARDPRPRCSSRPKGADALRVHWQRRGERSHARRRRRGGHRRLHRQRGPEADRGRLAGHPRRDQGCGVRVGTRQDGRHAASAGPARVPRGDRS